jgi:hypothetical protein
MIEQLKQNKILIVIAVLLVGFGLLKPNIGNIISPNNNSVVITDPAKITAPTDKDLLTACEDVTSALKDGGSSRKSDGVRLSSLFFDIASLIQLDGEDQTIKSTLEIREANRLAGTMCRLNLQGKYPGLSDACNRLVVAGIGDSDVVLDEESRKRAVETFMALSWACLQGSK